MVGKWGMRLLFPAFSVLEVYLPFGRWCYWSCIKEENPPHWSQASFYTGHTQWACSNIRARWEWKTVMTFCSFSFDLMKKHTIGITRQYSQSWNYYRTLSDCWCCCFSQKESYLKLRITPGNVLFSVALFLPHTNLRVKVCYNWALSSTLEQTHILREIFSYWECFHLLVLRGALDITSLESECCGKFQWS